ncbi:nucleotidyltransferase family protein [uncultured Desulfobacter sp.]|uniref:nucleotidyltransferase family protein n=1 Tax=uncultured Desulfobacter sp. TaxID=240139 RepID=UPI002AABEDE0|nr:nucleotidyltransferase family protein [uncultured Desulfobacter sp.]
MKPENKKDISCYSWAGLTLRFLSLPDILRHSVDKMFVLNHIPETDSGIDIRMTLEKDGAFISAMPDWVHRIYTKMEPGEDPYIQYTQENAFVVLLKGVNAGAFSVSFAPYKEISVVSQFSETEKSPLLFNTVLIPALRELLLNQGKALLHAGCVASPAGDAVLIIADSGGGKTSTTISLTRQGFKFISDDLITLSASDQGIIVKGISKPVNLTLKTIGFFPELEYLRLKKERSGDYKIPVDPVQIFKKDGMADQGIVKAVLIPRIARKGPELNKIELHESLPVLMKSHTFAHEAKKNEKSMKILWGLIENSTVYRLKTGNDPDGLGEWLAIQASKGRLGFSYALTKKNKPPKKKGSPGRKLPAPTKFKDSAKWFKGILDFSLGIPETNPQPVPNMDCPAVFHSLWESVKYHRLEPFAARWMTESEYGRSVPLWIDAEQIIADAKNRYQTVCAETVRIHHLLTQRHHDFLFLRGAGFASSYYPDPWLRHSRDIDVVCHADTISDIETLLMDDGYKPIPFRSRDYWISKGELPFQKQNITVEVHWDAYPVMPKVPNPFFSLQNCLDSAVTVPLQDTKIKCLNVNHLFLSSCFHAIWEHQFDRILRMVDIRQILQMNGEQIDWEWVWKHAQAEPHKTVLQHFLCCLQNTVLNDMPEQALKHLKPFAVKKYVNRLVLPWPCLVETGRASRFRRQLYTWMMQRF